VNIDKTREIERFNIVSSKHFLNIIFNIFNKLSDILLIVKFVTNFVTFWEIILCASLNFLLTYSYDAINLGISCVNLVLRFEGLSSDINIMNNYFFFRYLTKFVTKNSKNYKKNPVIKRISESRKQ